VKTYRYKGDRVTVTAGAIVNVDDVKVLSGGLIGVAVTSATAGEEYELAVSGVYELPMNPTLPVSVGADLNWDAVNGYFTPATVSAAGDVNDAGVAWQSVVAGTNTVLVKINAGQGIRV